MNDTWKGTRRAIALAVGIALGLALFAPRVRATGYEEEGARHVMIHAHHMTPPPVTSPPVTVPPPAPAPSPAPVAAAAPTAPPQQAGPSYKPASPWPGYVAFAATAVYFGLAIRSHWLFCAEDDKKKREERACYRPLRDGMPEAR